MKVGFYTDLVKAKGVQERFHGDKIHRKQLSGWEWPYTTISRLLASLPLIHAGYPFINVRAHKWEEHMQALFKVGYCGSK